MKYTVRYACHPHDAKTYDTKRIRDEFLIPTLFEDDEILMVYSLNDRFIVGGAKPVSQVIKLEPFYELKAPFFLARREMGIINVGGNARITADGVVYQINYKDALYLGMGVKEVLMESMDMAHPALLYINSSPAHRSYPTRKVTKLEAETVVLGKLDTSNHRNDIQMLTSRILPTCQLQMGLTELNKGSVWNTMPFHTHLRRMEVYFYFEVPHSQAICHFIGQPDETRHIWLNNNQAVISPSWSIHAGAGTSNYAFVWGMAGENIDYDDVDVRLPNELK